MKKELFEKWLDSKGVKSYGSYSSRIKSIESAYGSIDNEYDLDGCKSLLENFIYTKEDQNNKIQPKHSLPSKNTSGKDLYQSYFEGQMIFARE